MARAGFKVGIATAIAYDDDRRTVTACEDLKARAFDERHVLQTTADIYTRGTNQLPVRDESHRLR